MNKELKEFVEAVLDCIDTNNLQSSGKRDTSYLFHQLIGVQIALHTMGIQIDFDINPYYHQDLKASSYKLRIAQ